MANRVSIEVAVAEDPQGFTGSIQQIEKLEDRTVSLTSKMVAQRKELQALRADQEPFNKILNEGGRLTQEQGQQLARLIERESQVQNALKQTTSAQRTARQELGNLNFAQRDAAQTAQLLAAQVGVNLPAGMTTLITRSGGVQRALSSAFNASVIIGFGVLGGQALARLIVEITQFESTLQGLKQTVADVFSPFEAAARGLQEQNIAEANEKQADRIEAAMERIKKSRRDAALAPLEGEAKLQQQFFFDVEDLNRRAHAQGIPEAIRRQEFEALTLAASANVLTERREAMEKEAEEIEQILKRVAAAQEQFVQAQLGIKKQIAGQFGIEKQTGAGIDLDVEQKRLTQRQKTLQDIQSLEEDAAIKLLDPRRRKCSRCSYRYTTLESAKKNDESEGNALV